MTNLREHSGAGEEGRAGSAQNSVRSLPLTQPAQVFFHLDFRRAIEMRRRMVIFIMVGAVLLSAGYTARRWNTYKAESQVYVQPAPHRVIENGPAQSWPYDANTYESYIQQQVHDVTRPDVLAAAVNRLPGWRGSSESEQAAADRLGSAIEVVREGTAYEVSITATASSAAEAADMANAVATSYIESATRQERAGDPQRIALLRDERDRILKDLASDRAEQEDLTRKLGVAAVSSTAPDPIDDQITLTRAELVRAQSDNDQAAAKLTALGDQKNSSAALDAEADTLVAADPGLVSMKTSLNARRSALISQMANLTPNHPLYKQDAEELAKINNSLDSMTRELRAKAAAQIEQRLKNDLERTSTVKERLNAQLAQLTSEAGTAAPRLQRSNELATDIQRLQNRFTQVDEQYRNLTMENDAPGAVYLASAALPPLHAQHTKVFRNAFIVILAGLVLAIGGALLAYNLDPRIYVGLDVERVLGFPPMAQLPDFYEVGTGVAEEYLLRVAAAVEHAHQQGLLNSCIFTGVGAGAGVSTVSSRVSNLLEAMGRDTVLVDAVGAPSAEAAPAIQPGTDLVRAARGTRSTALLQQMAEETGEDTVVVTDTAPLLVSGETEYLARFVDAAIVVIESGITTKTQLRETARTLQRLEVGSVGFVLNRISLENADPSFRESVRAVEAHVRAQAKAVERLQSRPEAPQQPAAQDSAAAFNRLWDIVSNPEAQQSENSRENSPAAAAVTAAAPAANPLSKAPAEPAPPIQPRPSTAVDLPASSEPTPATQPAARPSAEQWGLPSYSRTGAGPAAPAPADTLSPASPKAPVPFDPAPEPQRAESWQAPAASVIRPQRGREAVGVPGARPAPAPAFEPAPPSVLSTSPVAPQPPPADRSLESAPRQVLPEPSVTAPLDTRTPPVPRPERAPEANTPVPALEPDPSFFASEFPSPFSRPNPPAIPDSLVPAVPAALALDPIPDGSQYNAASRLGGLRNLMTSLGVRNLHKEVELRKTYSEPEPRPERLQERAVFAQPETPSQAMRSVSSAPTAEVTASPEIIPPSVVFEPVEREKDSRGQVKSPRVSRWDSPDDVDTLPSWRGQYRKRR